jgi:putative DNA methylase
MTQPYKKKLIEVAIPLEAINVASAREKSIRHGHPSTLHLWWARRPLAACRAVLFAQLVDDPSSLPDQFPTEELQKAERDRLFAIIEDLVKWENSTNEEVLERARAEIRRSCGGVLPPVYDPFSGGGSIPLEAQRLGLPAYGSDLNPVAVMIGKAMIEIPPKFKDQKPIHPGIKGNQYYRNAEGLAEDVKFYGDWMRDKAFQRIGHLYPQVDLSKNLGGGKGRVIGWFWSRTVPSPDPAFAGVQVPIASSFLLSAKTGKETWLEPIVDKVTKTVRFSVRSGGTKTEIEKANEGTKAGRAVFRCIFSDAPISGEYIDDCATKGLMSSTLMAIAVEGKGRRTYVPAGEELQAAAISEAERLLPSFDLSAIEVPCRGTFASNALGRRYGFNTFKDYFTSRQLVALHTFSQLILEVREKIRGDIAADGQGRGRPEKFADEYSAAVVTYLAFAVDRAADAWSSVVSWRNTVEATRSTFARQGISMVWDYVEVNPFSDKNGNWNDACLEWVYKSLSAFAPSSLGTISQADAQTVHLPPNSVLSTDPPYYDNILYSDLSDFFYVWLRDSIGKLYPDIFRTIVVPKAEELVATVYRHGSYEAAEQFFLNGMTLAVSNMAAQTSPDFPASIYYAFKQSEVESDGIASTGWATFLQAVINSGYAVVATWPVRTEKPGRMISVGTNALANSVVLVCRKKEASAETITRAEFIRALNRELPPAIKELQAANIAPADMPQSAIGPGMGVFSRYRAVLESDDSPMSVKAALQLINRELGEHLEGIQGEFDADTRFAVTWFEQNGLKAGDYGTANNIATARGISVESVKHAGIVESQAGKVRVLRRDELDEKWKPGTDQHLTIWECLQHLVRLHEKDGISQATAILLKKIGDKAEAVKDLAYILYDISANKRQDAKEATAYNALIADWTELSRHAATIHDTRGNLQQQLDL